jgi:hypothetical protein
MKTDVQSPADREKEALQWATEFFREYSKPGSESAASEDYITNHLLALHYGATPGLTINAPPEQREASILEICQGAQATRDKTLIRGLCRFAGNLLIRGEQLSGPICLFAADFLANPDQWKPSRSKSHGQLYRNLLIRIAVQTICDRWKFDETRYEGAEHQSAASIVREALEKGAGIKLTEKAINKVLGIWSREAVLRQSHTTD